MKRTLLTTSIALSISSLFVAGACTLEEGGTGSTAGTSAGGTGTNAGTGPVAGSPTTGGMATGGMATGGMPTGGMATGGMATGGMATGGTAGGGGGGNADPISVVEMKNGNGFALKDSFFLVPCVEVAGHDCLTVKGDCPNQGTMVFEEKGSTFSEDFQMAGDPTKTYAVTIHVNGVVEGKYYNGGMRRDGANYATANAATGSDGWHVGGNAIASSYNVFKITVLKKDMTEVAHYYLNSYPQASGFESHQTVLLGYDATFDVPGDGIVRYLNQDSNCRAINNCGPGDNGEVCPAARSIPNEPNLVMPTMYAGKTVASINVVNGAAQPFHAQMVHVTVTKVEAK